MTFNPLHWRWRRVPPPPPPVTFEQLAAVQADIIAKLNASQSQEIKMSVKSILDKIGADAKGVFKWLGSTQGQNVVTEGEAVIEAVDPGATGVINLANNWLAEVIKTEALAAAAGSQTGTGTQKAAMVLSAVTPEALAVAKANGLSAPTGAQLAAANTALVAFLNAFTVAEEPAK